MNLKKLTGKKITDSISKREAVKLARKLLGKQIRQVGYGEGWEDFVEKVGGLDNASAIMFEQVKKACKAIGEEAYMG